jgi:hypothetical protein
MTSLYAKTAYLGGIEWKAYEFSMLQPERSVCSLHYHVQNDLAAYSMSTECKEMSCETENSPPVSAQFRNAWSYTSPSFISHRGVGIMHSDCKATWYSNNSKVKKLQSQIRTWYDDIHG